MEEGVANLRPPTRAGGARNRNAWNNSKIHLARLPSVDRAEPAGPVIDRLEGDTITSAATRIAASAVSTAATTSTPSECHGRSAFRSKSITVGGLPSVGLPGEDLTATYEPLAIDPYSSQSPHFGIGPQSTPYQAPPLHEAAGLPAPAPSAAQNSCATPAASMLQPPPSNLPEPLSTLHSCLKPPLLMIPSSMRVAGETTGSGTEAVIDEPEHVCAADGVADTVASAAAPRTALMVSPRLPDGRRLLPPLWQARAATTHRTLGLTGISRSQPDERALHAHAGEDDVAAKIAHRRCNSDVSSRSLLVPGPADGCDGGSGAATGGKSVPWVSVASGLRVAGLSEPASSPPRREEQRRTAPVPPPQPLPPLKSAPLPAAAAVAVQPPAAASVVMPAAPGLAWVPSAGAVPGSGDGAAPDEEGAAGDHPRRPSEYKKSHGPDSITGVPSAAGDELLRWAAPRAGVQASAGGDDDVARQVMGELVRLRGRSFVLNSRGGRRPTEPCYGTGTGLDFGAGLSAGITGAGFGPAVSDGSDLEGPRKPVSVRMLGRSTTLGATTLCAAAPAPLPPIGGSRMAKQAT